MPKSYLVQEEDGTSRFALEDGSGFILLLAAGLGATVAGTDRPEAAVTGGDFGATVDGGDTVLASIIGGDAAVASGEASTVTGGDRSIATVRPT